MTAPARAHQLALPFALAAALIPACRSSAPTEARAPADATSGAATADAPATRGKPAYGSFGFDAAGMDRKVAPGDDFYRHANGAWLDATEIPPDRSSYGLFTRLADLSSDRTREIIERAAKAPSSDEERKIGDAYAAFMDEAAIEARGATPLRPELDRIAGLRDRKALSAELGGTLRADVDALNTGDMTTDRLLGLWVTADLDQPDRTAAYLFQGGLGLPDRDYYLDKGARFAEIRARYAQHVAAMLRLAGLSDPDARARRVIALERRIAQVHWSRNDSQDIVKAHNRWTPDLLVRRAPGIDWKVYLVAAGLDRRTEIMVWQPSALIGISRLVKSQPLQTWKDYLAYHAIERGAPFLSRAFVDEAFAFGGAFLTGTAQQRDRWKRAVDFTGVALGDAIGRLYVAKYFPPEAKAAADDMVKNIVAALGQRIEALAWMKPETRARAREKLATLQVGIGHPASWQDYGGLEIRRDDAHGNAERASRFELARALAKLDRPYDRSEWFMVPQQVNALNSPQQNSIIFPAAILQPPFFDPHADPAVNYGGIGTVIGHEIVHSFDDVGAQFDARGKLANWWTAEDLTRFRAAGKALAAQYGAYRPFPDLALDGELTLGENIADVAGVTIAHGGYRLSLGGREAPVIDGFTGDQRFFLGFAQVWRRKYREPALRQLVLTDGHSPGQFRAAAARNVDAWYGAFDVKPGQKLYLAPDQRVQVW
jgi:putative endopeptidase